MNIKILSYLCVLIAPGDAKTEFVSVSNSNTTTGYCEDKTDQSLHVLPNLDNISIDSPKERDIVVPADVCHIDAHNSADKISAMLSCLQADKEWFKI